MIATIRKSKDKRDAKNNLMEEYGFTELQSEAIVSLKLYRLTNTDITQLQTEADELAKKIKEYEEILASEKKLQEVIIKELTGIKKKYADERRSKIEEKIEELKIDLEVLVGSEDVIVTVTKEGYIKRTSLRSFGASSGEATGMKETDQLLAAYEMNTTDVILLFTTKGNYLYCPIHELPDIRWKDVGQHISTLISIESNEGIVSAVPIKNFEEEKFLFFITKKGMVKKSQLSQYKAQRFAKPLIAINLKDDDELVDVHITDGSNEILLATNLGYGLRFHETEVKPIGVRAAGVKGINLKEADYVVAGSAITQPDHQFIVIATHRGAVKRMALDEFEMSTRAKRGLIMLRELKNNPHRLVGFVLAELEDKVIITSEKNMMEKIEVRELRLNDRYSNGSFFFDEEEAGRTTAISLLVEEPKKITE